MYNFLICTYAYKVTGSLALVRVRNLNVYIRVVI